VLSNPKGTQFEQASSCIRCACRRGEDEEMTMTSKPTVDSAVPCLRVAAVTWFTSMNQSNGRERGAVFTAPLFSVSTASLELQYCAVTHIRFIALHGIAHLCFIEGLAGEEMVSVLVDSTSAHTFWSGGLGPKFKA
jgi:hypothetical protein